MELIVFDDGALSNIVISEHIGNYNKVLFSKAYSNKNITNDTATPIIFPARSCISKPLSGTTSWANSKKNDKKKKISYNFN